RHNPADSTSLPTNEVVSLHEDHSGTLWIGTNGGSVCTYDRQKDVFRRLPVQNGFDRKNNVVRAITSDYLKRVWISNVNGLSVFDPQSGKITSIPVGPPHSGKLATKTVLCLFEDSKRRLWVGSADGLFLYNRAKNSFTQYTHVAGDPESLAGNAVRSIDEDLKGSIWVGTDRGLSKLLPDGRKFRNFQYGHGKKAVSSSDIYSVVADQGGKLWLGSEEGINI